MVVWPFFICIIFVELDNFLGLLICKMFGQSSGGAEINNREAYEMEGGFSTWFCYFAGFVLRPVFSLFITLRADCWATMLRIKIIGLLIRPHIIFLIAKNSKYLLSSILFLWKHLRYWPINKNKNNQEFKNSCYSNHQGWWRHFIWKINMKLLFRWDIALSLFGGL